MLQVKITFTTSQTNHPGNERGVWHSDWPYNQSNLGHVEAPYPAHPAPPMHLTTLWALTRFDERTGGTLVVPNTHRQPTNPSDPRARGGGLGHPERLAHPQERQVHAAAGSVLVMDSRLWHAIPPNTSEEPRVAVAVRYGPWWLDSSSLLPDSHSRRRLAAAMPGLSEPEQPPLPVLRSAIDFIVPQSSQFLANN